MVAALKKPVKKSETRPERRRPPTNRIAIWGPMLVVLVVGILLVAGIWRHVQAKREREEFAKKMAQVRVEFSVIKRDQKPQEILLPGNIQAYEEATIYARTSGYIKRWLVDIGDKVTEGQLLAEIETPEVDQQLAEAKGNLKQSEANFEIARTSAQRWQELAQNKVVSKQENDERQSTYQASSAGLTATKANVARLEQLQAFNQVTAPFAGTVTGRKIDVGALVSAGSGTSGTALFTLAKIDPVNVYVNVPQSQAPLIGDGLPVEVLVQEYPGRPFKGAVSRSAGALDAQARTMQTQVQIPNNDGALLTGMYAQVKFTLHDATAPLTIPGNAFVFRPDGAQVVTLDDSNKIHWQPISVGRDFGDRMEVLKGIEENTRIVINPTDDLTEGLTVEAKPADEKKPEAQGAQNPGGDKKGANGGDKEKKEAGGKTDGGGK